GLGGQNLFARRAGHGLTLAQKDLTRGAFRGQFLRTRGARRRRGQAVFGRHHQGGAGHGDEFVRHDLGQADALLHRSAGAQAEGRAGGQGRDQDGTDTHGSFGSGRRARRALARVDKLRGCDYDFSWAAPTVVRRSDRKLSRISSMTPMVMPLSAMLKIHGNRPVPEKSRKSTTPPKRMRSMTLPTAPPMTRPMAATRRRRFARVAHQASRPATTTEKMLRIQRPAPPPNRPKLTPVFST